MLAFHYFLWENFTAIGDKPAAGLSPLASGVIECKVPVNAPPAYYAATSFVYCIMAILRGGVSQVHRRQLRLVHLDICSFLPANLEILLSSSIVHSMLMIAFCCSRKINITRCVIVINDHEASHLHLTV